MPKQGPNRYKRVPKLSFTDTQGIGWNVSFRDKDGVPPGTGLVSKSVAASSKLGSSITPGFWTTLAART